MMSTRERLFGEEEEGFMKIVEENNREEWSRKTEEEISAFSEAWNEFLEEGILYYTG